MNFFQRIGNALSRFMYGRNGVDRLCLTMIWAALLLDVINLFLRDRQSVVYSILAFVSTVIVFLALYRMFSRNLEKRRSENARFMEKVWNPVSRRIAGSRQQRMDKEHRYCLSRRNRLITSSSTLWQTVCRGEAQIFFPK